MEKTEQTFVGELGFHLCDGWGGESLPEHVLEAGAATREAAAIWRQEKLFPHSSLYSSGLPACNKMGVNHGRNNYKDTKP